MQPQRTISQPVSLSGPGLFHSDPVTLTFRPAPANHGIVFVRSDQQHTHIPALIQYVVKRPRRTALSHHQVSIETTEHCLSAVAGAGIDNLIIEVNGSELPALDGSALPFYQALQQAGITNLDQEREVFEITETVAVHQDGAMVAAVPSEGAGLQVLYELDYSHHPFLGRQLRTFDLAKEDYAQEIAPARTYVMESEAKALRAAGMGLHLTAADILVYSEQGPLAPNQQRFADEPVRHKIVDLIGDLCLLGAPIKGRIIACRSGHALNQALVRKLIKLCHQRKRNTLALHRNVFDARKLLKILPHRYPMLLVDRVIEIDGDRRALGVKNVTINEPFFTGHYPGVPIMPGVLIVEAMAQLSGVLIGQSPQNAGKMAILLSLDRVKLRRPVTPGDQLILEAEAVRGRARISHMRCHAYVGEELAAEAEVKFMLVDEERT